MNWDYILELAINVVVLLPVLMINGWLSVWAYKRNQRRREMKFLKSVSVHHPDKKITYTAVATSDEGALKEIKEMFEDEVHRAGDEHTFSRTY